jgi:teichoic acid glycerol-phosphate primase
MDYAGLIYDDSRHFIDHLAPFCALMGWPLIICEDVIAELAIHYYPDLKVIQKNIFQLKLPTTVVTCDNRPILRAAFPGQDAKILWLPHGNSDKGAKGPFFECLNNEIALVYGQKMIDFMHEKNVFPKTFKIGNFRWQYYLKHKAFYKKLVDAVLPKTTRNFLYAPTWDDAEGNGSFWKAFPQMAHSVPSDCHLFVKLHPNTVRKHEVELEILMGRYAKKKNIFFLPEFPPIYPLLSFFDAYIGDMSSIGYDFLKFDKPLFFLNANPQLYLSRCGTPIQAERFDFQATDRLSSVRKEAYAYTFHAEPEWAQLKEQLHALCGV